MIHRLAHRLARVVALSALALPLFARTSRAAGPVPVAPPFRLAACPLCEQENPRLAGVPNGKLVTAYDIELIPPAPVVQARVFPAKGVAPAPLRPQAALTPAQYDATVAANATGAFVVAWSTIDAATRNSEVRAQRYDAGAKPVGATIPVNLDPPGVRVLDTVPAVAMAADGGFTVTWMRVVPPGQPNPTGHQIWARRFTAAGAAASPPRRVSVGLVEGVRPGLCIDTSGRSIITWATDDEPHPFEPSKIGVAMRRLTARGALLGGEVVVAKALAAESHPAISCGPANTFAIAWDTNQPPATGLVAVVAQRYGANAVKVGTPFLVSASAADRQRTPAIAHDAGGNFVVVWQNLGSTTAGIYGQRFSPAAVKLGARFIVASAESVFIPLAAPTVSAAGAANAFAVAWTNPRLGVFGRRFKIVP